MKNGKRTLAVLLVLVLAVAGFMVYNKNKPPEEEAPPVSAPSEPEPSEPAPPAYPTVELTDHTNLYETYLRPFYTVGILGYSWSSYQEIEPDQLANVIVAMSDSSGWTEENWHIAAGTVEQVARQFLDVPVEYMRTSGFYNAATGKYDLMGIGAPLRMRITGASREADMLTITFEALSRADDKTPIWRSEVAIRLEGNQFKYLSCKHEVLEADLTYTGPFDDLLTFMGPEWFMALAFVLLPIVYLIRRRMARTA